MAKLDDRSLAEARAELDRAVARWRETTGELPEAATDTGLPVAGVYTPLDVAEVHAELPGEYPYTRGIHPSMYRGRLWTMRLYAGWGGPEDTNARFRYLLEQGQTGLSVALDLPTQMGLDSDHPLAAGEVGKVGVAIDSLADLERVFEGIPLDRVSTSFTINATAPILLAMYQVVGERQGVAPAELRGTVQNDVLKEFLARKTYIYPPGPSLRLAAEVIEYSCRNLPKLNPISVCGYHMRQAGCDAVQEIAFTLANASAYVRGRGRARARRRRVRAPLLVQRVDDAGLLRGDRQAPCGEEAMGADHARAVRRARSPLLDAAAVLRRRRDVADRRRAAQQHRPDDAPDARDRALRRAGGAHHVYDEALALPSEEAALVALRTQQIVAYESGAARTADPLGGSYYLETLTDELERRAGALLAEIEEEGVLRGIEDGSLELAIAEAAYRQEQAIESGERVVVGVNRFRDEGAGAQDVEVLSVPDSVRASQLERLAAVRSTRDGGRVEVALGAVREAAASERSTMPAIFEAVRAYATVGEIAGALGDVFGYHQASTVV